MMTRFLNYFIGVILIACNYNSVDAKKNETDADPKTIEWQRFKKSIDSAKILLPKILKDNSWNEHWVIIANLSIHSGLPRMVLLDMVRNKIADSGCVAHRYGKETFSRKAVFSNIPGSYCSSLGKYLIEEKYKGNFGMSYKLKGVEKSNNNAFARFIVLHPYWEVSDTAIYPAYNCNSQGCPMIAPAFLKRLSAHIDASAKPILLWIVN